MSIGKNDLNNMLNFDYIYVKNHLYEYLLYSLIFNCFLTYGLIFVVSLWVWKLL